MVYLFSCKVCGMQYSSQTNDGFRFIWNNYKDNTQIGLQGEEHKPACFFAHFRTASRCDFIYDTEIRFTDKTDSSRPTTTEDFP